MFKMVYMYVSILNDLPKFECQKLGYKQDTEVKIHCNINKAQILYLFTNIVKYNVTISCDKMTHDKQFLLI